jgi:HEAT repeat protein
MPDPAVTSLAEQARNDAGKLTQLLAILADRARSVATRLTALHALQRLTFSSRLFRSMNAQYVAALRGLLDDPSQELREAAVETLAQKKDEVIQQRLLDGLERRETPLVDDARAILLLAHDIHAGQFPTVRKLARESADADTRFEAVQFLSSDPESADLLLQIFDNRNEDEEVRRASAGALLAVAPERFAARARQAVLDESESEGVRLASLTALSHSASVDSLPADPQFLASVSKIKTNDDELGKAVQTFKDEHGIA